VLLLPDLESLSAIQSLHPWCRKMTAIFPATVHQTAHALHLRYDCVPQASFAPWEPVQLCKTELSETTHLWQFACHADAPLSLLLHLCCHLGRPPGLIRVWRCCCCCLAVQARIHEEAVHVGTQQGGAQQVAQA
jgi:hypothetical protein